MNAFVLLLDLFTPIWNLVWYVVRRVPIDVTEATIECTRPLINSTYTFISRFSLETVEALDAFFLHPGATPLELWKPMSQLRPWAYSLMGVGNCECRDIGFVFNVTLAPLATPALWFSISNLTYNPFWLFIGMATNATGGCTPYCDVTSCTPYCGVCTAVPNSTCMHGYKWGATRINTDPIFDTITNFLLNYAYMFNAWINVGTSVIWPPRLNSETRCSVVLADRIATLSPPGGDFPDGISCEFNGSRTCNYMGQNGQIRSIHCPCGGFDTNGETLVPNTPGTPACPFAECESNLLDGCDYYYAPQPNYFRLKVTTPRSINNPFGSGGKGGAPQGQWKWSGTLKTGLRTGVFSMASTVSWFKTIIRALVNIDKLKPQFPPGVPGANWSNIGSTGKERRALWEAADAFFYTREAVGNIAEIAFFFTSGGGGAWFEAPNLLKYSPVLAEKIMQQAVWFAEFWYTAVINLGESHATRLQQTHTYARNSVGCH
jgi:hypothetical protein